MKADVFEVFRASRPYKGRQWRYRNLEGDPKGVKGMWFAKSEAAERFLRGLFPRARIFVRRAE